MAKTKTQSTTSNCHAKPKRKRKGVHSKCKRSVHKSSKNYVKPNRGQGK